MSAAQKFPIVAMNAFEQPVDGRLLLFCFVVKKCYLAQQQSQLLLSSRGKIATVIVSEPATKRSSAAKAIRLIASQGKHEEAELVSVEHAVAKASVESSEFLSMPARVAWGTKQPDLNHDAITRIQSKQQFSKIAKFLVKPSVIQETQLSSSELLALQAARDQQNRQRNAVAEIERQKKSLKEKRTQELARMRKIVLDSVNLSRKVLQEKLANIHRDRQEVALYRRQIREAQRCQAKEVCFRKLGPLVNISNSANSSSESTIGESFRDVKSDVQHFQEKQTDPQIELNQFFETESIVLQHLLDR